MVVREALWWRQLRRPEIAQAVADLRDQAFSSLLWITGGAYLGWLVTATIVAPIEEAPRPWVTSPGAALTFLGTIWLHRRRSSASVWFFLGAAQVTVSLALWLLPATAALFFYPLIVSGAVVLLHPFAGLFFTATGLGFLGGFRLLGLAPFIGPDQILTTGVIAILTIAAAWALGRQFITAVEWSLQSYAAALQHAQAAQQHRAELVQALRQLDQAYYRLRQANAALEAAWKAAEAAERAKAEFVANISHELRTPLNLIVGFSELILTMPESYGVLLPAPYRGDLNAIYRSAQHLLALTNDVIDLARIGMGRLALAREPVDLRQIILDAVGLLREYIAAKGLWLRLDLASDLPLVSADPVRVRQVLLNLLTNAARFTEEGGITIRASCEGEWLVVRVADTGPGIPPEDLPYIFEEFYTKDHGRRRGYTGFGLGLPLSRRLIELHGGHMGVESQPGAGTTFWFTLPVEVHSLSPEETRRKVSLYQALGGGQRVLVLAHPEPALARFLQDHLRGYRIVRAPDLPQALQMAAEYRALALLVDTETCIPAELSFPMPVIRLPLPYTAQLAERLGVAAYLVKPVTRADLRAALSRLGRPPQRVLIVDDDLRFVRLLERFVRTLVPSAQIRAAYTGQEALAALTAEPVELLLLDLVLPDLSGQAVLETIRARSSDPPAVIVISARGPLGGETTLGQELLVRRSAGFRLEEVLNLLEGVLAALTPSPSHHQGRAGPPPGGHEAHVPVRPAE